MKVTEAFHNFANAPQYGKVTLLLQTLKSLNVTVSVYPPDLEQDLLAGHREHVNVPSGSIKTGRQVLDR